MRFVLNSNKPEFVEHVVDAKMHVFSVQANYRIVFRKFAFAHLNIDFNALVKIHLELNQDKEVKKNPLKGRYAEILIFMDLIYFKKKKIRAS